MESGAQPGGDSVASVALQADAGRIVTEMLGCRVLQAQVIRRGVMTFKCLVQTENAGDAIVRFYPAGRQAVVECEPDLWARCQAAGFPVPRVLGDSRTGPRSPLAYVVYERIAGETVADQLPRLGPEQQMGLAAELASWVHQFQRIEFENYGELLDGRTARDSSWLAFVDRSFRTGLQALTANALLDGAMVEQLGALAARIRDIPRPTPHALVWGDISFANVLADDGGRVTGFIDFESCLSGDPIATLGWCFAAHGDLPFCEALLHAWPTRLKSCDLDRVMLYAVVRALRLAPYAHLPLPTGHARDPLLQIFPGLKLALTKLGPVPSKMGG